MTDRTTGTGSRSCLSSARAALDDLRHRASGLELPSGARAAERHPGLRLLPPNPSNRDLEALARCFCTIYASSEQAQDGEPIWGEGWRCRWCGTEHRVDVVGPCPALGASGGRGRAGGARAPRVHEPARRAVSLHRAGRRDTGGMTMASPDHLDSYYTRTAAPLETGPPLTGGLETDVAIIGGDLAGLSAAISLLERGHQDVTILAARTVGWGASGRNAGSVVAGFALPVWDVDARVGPEHGRRLFDLSREAVALVRSRIDRYRIPCAPFDGGLVKAWWTPDLGV